jgi:catechol 2,3-dioxygenase-like lactoylglutathione lyase family enzyme
MGNQNLDIDNVAVSIFPIGARFTPRENDGTLRVTDNTHLDHIAFSFRDLNAAHRRIRKLGVGTVKPMSLDKEYGFRHFFVRAPNGILVELVEARPWPEAAWER